MLRPPVGARLTRIELVSRTPSKPRHSSWLNSILPILLYA